MSLLSFVREIRAHLRDRVRSPAQEIPMATTHQSRRKPPASVHLGAASVVGPVRKENQDRVRTGRITSTKKTTLDLVIVADGLGGHPHGGEAAEVASSHAIARLRREIPSAFEADAEGVRTLLVGTVWSAATRLARDAQAEGWVGPEGGFRTTLILCAVLSDCYVLAWIGDGGVFLLRDGESDPLAVLEPHKDPATPNLLTASLGPVTEGRPSWAIAPRRAGDVLVACTDGVADLFDAARATQTREALKAAAGDAALTAENLVSAFAAEVDTEGEHVFTDNLTIALWVGR